MTIWTDRVQQHSAFQNLDAIGRLLEMGAPTVYGRMSDLAEKYDRLQQVVSYAQSSLGMVDPNLLTNSMLESINRALTGIHSPLSEFVQLYNPVSLDQANDNADALLDQLHVLPAVRSPDDVQDIREAITALRQSMGQNARRNNEDVDQAKSQVATALSQVANLEAVINTQLSRVDAALDRFQAQFSNAQENRSNEFAQTQTARADVARELERENHARFTEVSAQLQSQTREALESLNTIGTGAVEEIRQSRAKLESDLRDSAESAIGSIETQRAKAIEIVGLIAQTGMAGGFQKIANEEQKSAKSWLKIATGAFIGLIASAVVALVPQLHSGSGWDAFATRVYVSLTFAALAGFAARQASIHQQTERKNRQMELEIASLGPFLAQLPEDDRHKLINQFADRSFGQISSEMRLQSDVKLPAQAMFDLLKTTVDAVIKSKG